MVGRLLARFGVDAVQVRALVVTGIKLDMRGPSIETGGASGWSRLAMMFLMYLVLGLALGAVALFAPDVFLSGTVVLSATMFMVGASVLMEFAAVVVSPLDYDVLGYRPITSQTYFLARFANVIFYTGMMTTAIGILPIAAYFFAGGFNVLLGLAAVLAFYLACIATTLSLILVYVGVARIVHPQRLRRVLTYVQLVSSFTVYGGYFLMPQLFKPDALRQLSVRKSSWMLLYPPTWFASYLDVALGKWSLAEILPSLATFVALALLAYLAVGRLSLDYSEVLGRQASASEGVRREHRQRLLNLMTGERRAVALLIRAQFRYDQRFRLGVLSTIPLSAFYLVMAINEGSIQDPFVRGSGSGNAMVLYFAIVFIPMMLVFAVSRSDSFQAAWIFYVTPARRVSLVLAAKDLTVALLMVPYLAVLAVAFAYFFRNPLHAFLHVLVEGLVANVFLLVVVALQPELPFSRPVQKGQTSAGFFVVVFAGFVVQAISAPLLSAYVYPHALALAALIALLAAVGWWGQSLLRRHLERSTAPMEFAG